jgi:hypothetical protein
MAGATKENLQRKICKEKSVKENLPRKILPRKICNARRSVADLLPILRQSAEAALVPVFSRIW